MKIFIDRIETELAVCQREDETFVTIPICELPKDVKEGSVLNLDSGKLTFDEVGTDERKKALFEKQNLIFGD